MLATAKGRTTRTPNQTYLTAVSSNLPVSSSSRRPPNPIEQLTPNPPYSAQTNSDQSHIRIDGAAAPVGVLTMLFTSDLEDAEVGLSSSLAGNLNVEEAAAANSWIGAGGKKWMGRSRDVFLSLVHYYIHC